MIVHISDIHFGAEDRGALEVAARFVDEHRPRLVIAAGDLTAVGVRSEMKAAFDWLRSLPAPVIATPGNHDTPYFKLWSRLLDPFGNFRRAHEGVHTESLIDGDLVVTPITTARGAQLRVNWALGAVSSKQIEAAAHILTAAPADALKIVVTHHPPPLAGRRPDPRFDARRAQGG